MKKILLLITTAVILGACSERANVGNDNGVGGPSGPTETAEEFIDRVNAEFKEYRRELNAAGWLRATYINEDSAIVDALANERYAAWHTAKVKEAMQYDGQDLDPATRRALDLLKASALMVAPDDDAKRKELSQILTEMRGMYGAGQYCRNDDECFGGSELSWSLCWTLSSSWRPSCPWPSC